MLQAMSTL